MVFLSGIFDSLTFAVSGSAEPPCTNELSLRHSIVLVTAQELRAAISK